MAKGSYTGKGIKDFDLTHTFECGQCFRWEKQEDGSYTGVAMGRVVNMRFDGADLTVTPCGADDFDEIWAPYLDLSRDYGEIKRSLIKTDGVTNGLPGAERDVMKRAAEYGYGIRILGQDLWETIVSFIISQNNNIPRIKGCIARLCENFGEPVENTLPGELSAGITAFDIPSAEKLAGLTEDDLAPVRLGYRAKYIVETARAVAEHGLPENFEDLSSLCGVGPKVASCISLFGMRGYSSFPIDVWVMKVMHELYGLDEGDKKSMAAFARETFGDLGGFAQQYLFYFMRDRA